MGDSGCKLEFYIYTYFSLSEGIPLTEDDVKALEKLLNKRDSSLELEGIRSEVLTTDSSGKVNPHHTREGSTITFL